MKKYYVGLDIGTNSVGWAVTDEEYNLCRYKKKSMWGIRLFEEAGTAADRRMKRTMRRRLQRRNQRIDLLQELFSKEITLIDPSFFIRLNESRLHIEDKSVAEKYPLFIDKNYNDIDYYKQYPTIYHLRKELMKSKEPHDIRLLYLALHHIIKYRGHFLIEGELGNAKNFSIVFKQLEEVIEQEFNIELQVENMAELEDVIKDRNVAKSEKAKKIMSLMTFDEETYTSEERKRRKTIIDNICKLIVGNKGDIAKIFEGDTEGIEKTSFSFSDASFDESIRPALEESIPDKCFVLDCIKAVYDWNILVDILNGEEYLSSAKVKQYEKHSENLSILKKFMRKYAKAETYKQFFDDCSGKVNYASYIGNVKTRGKKQSVKRCSEDDFYKQLKKILDQMNVEESDKAQFENLIRETEFKTLLPLQRSKDNGVIPNQAHRAELEKILENAEQYVPFLKEKDENGISISNKIISLFTFRIPYYVGPLSDRHKDEGSNTWMVRKCDGKIFPWNFEEKVDREQSNEAFIARMTNKCTYLLGEDVIPKNSLLYSRFMVLNELNNLKIRGKDISVKLKQDIYENLFMKRTKITGKMLLNYLKANDQDLRQEDLSGFDQDFKANLSSYIDFTKQVFGDRMSEDHVREMVEEIIKWKTIYGDDNKMLDVVIKKHYPGEITEEQLKSIHKFRYSGWGTFSKKFLSGIEGVNLDEGTGEMFTIINALWETNNNLMQLLSRKFSFTEEIEKLNTDKSGKITEISYDALMKDLYVSPANKRAIWQTIQIVEEIKKVMGNPPTKIFVEMARGEEKKKERKKSRKTQLLELYEGCKTDTREWSREIEERDERDFNSIKLYLYYTQMGRCMYTGEHIDLDELMSANSKWDRDHIYPQSKIKDDSLDNLVLVKKNENAKKTNGMLNSDIQKNQKAWWSELLNRGLISKKKYDRLTRKDDFTLDELTGFISRQLVETRQSSKAVAQLLNQLYDDTKIVYVKAALASQFRQKELNILKSRLANDYHHAKDAYLNIVVGDVYDAKFTSNPRRWLQEHYKDNYSINRVFDFDVYRGKTCIWKGPELDNNKKAKINAEGGKYGGTIDRIRAIVSRNDILYTEYTYCGKGQLFNETIAKKTEGALIPLKAGLDPKKYGGYKSANTSYFALIEFDRKKGERVRNIMEVPIYVANILEQNPNAYLEYCEKIKGLKNVKILRQCIKKNSLIVVDGFPMRIRGANEKNIIFKNNLQPMFGKYEDTVRQVEKYLEKNEGLEISEKYDNLNERNLTELYDLLTEKLLTVYKKRPANQGEFLLGNRENFIHLPLKQKAKLVTEIIIMVKCSAETKCDLTLIGGSSSAGAIAINKNTVGKSKIVLVNQSITGLFENRMEL